MAIKVAIIDPSGFTLPYDHCLASALVQQGCDVVLVTSQIPSRPWNDNIRYEQWRHFYRVGSNLRKEWLRIWVKGWEHAFDMIRLLSRLHEWKPDIIHFQWLPLPLVDAIFMPFFRKIAPLLLTIHNSEAFHGDPASIIRLAGLKDALQYFDHYIVHTYYSKQKIIQKLSLHPEKITVIKHGVFNYYRKLITNPQPVPSWVNYKKKVLFFGLIRPYKGIDVLLQSFAQLPETIKKETSLIIAGRPKMDVEPLKALSKKLGIDDNVFWDLHFIREEEVAFYFLQADVVVLPYRHIDQSGVLMTALAFGKPVIASRIGGFVETIMEGVHGFLVNPEDVTGLARALARILTDDVLREQMSQAVQQLADELSWSAIAAKTCSLYKQILAKKFDKS